MSRVVRIIRVIRVIRAIFPPKGLPGTDPGENGEGKVGEKLGDEEVSRRFDKFVAKLFETVVLSVHISTPRLK